MLAPGVLTVIEPSLASAETFSGPLPLSKLDNRFPELVWTPNLTAQTRTLKEMGDSTVLRRNIWCLEFAFKPLRMIRLNMAQSDGRVATKRVWYMVYRVRYPGNELWPEPKKDRFDNEFFPNAAQSAVTFRRFLPHFVLQDVGSKDEYLDRVIPAAAEPVARRERIGSKLYNSVEMVEQKIPLNRDRLDRGVWGIVTWENLDPRIDHFCIYAQGLSNAFQFGSVDGDFPPQLRRKTLKLNFWRPGDSVLEHEEEIRYGIPLDQDTEKQAAILKMYEQQERLDYVWVYR